MTVVWLCRLGPWGASAHGMWVSLATAAWFGLVVGLIDLGITLARVQTMQHGLFRNKSPHLVWMTPVSNLAMFMIAGMLAWLAGRMNPPARRSIEFFVLSLLAVFAVFLALPGIRAVACLILAVGASSWLGPWLAARAARVGEVVRRTLVPLILVLTALGGWAFGRDWLAERLAVAGRPATVPAGAPNVLLVVMDTVRADATSLDPGAARDTTPGLLRLAERGVRFNRAIATAPWTLPSHASLFTGLWPWQLEVGIDRPLGRGPETLAERFSRAGYATAGFVANTVFCSAEYGLSRGFSHYEDYAITSAEALRSSSLGWLIANRVVRRLLDQVLPLLGREPRHPFESDVRRKDAAEVGSAALRWIDRQEGGRPFFVFLNYMDAHDPYLLPAGVPWKFARPSSPSDYRILKEWATLDKGRLTGRELALARDAYDDGIAYLDSQLERLLAELNRRGILDNTILVVTSDHGEHFGKHAREGTPIYGHAMSLYQAEVRVPMLIVAPGRVPAGQEIDRPVSLRDVPATLIELAGLDAAPSMPGTSLVRHWSDGKSGGDEPIEAVLTESALLSHLPYDRRYREASPGLMRAVISSDLSYHLIGEDREELYHLGDDPGEHNDLASTTEAAPILEQMRGLLGELVPLSR